MYGFDGVNIQKKKEETHKYIVIVDDSKDRMLVN